MKKTLHPAFRVSDLTASLAFYTALGYGEVGRVDIPGGTTLIMLKFPAEEAVSLELAHQPDGDPVRIGTAFSHLPVQVDDISAPARRLSDHHDRDRYPAAVCGKSVMITS
ncbi:MAG TPA: VOC family protein [Streptosporangiaceae bacterium]|nr:VOC family protein [Streptosporangiaceae bacterium]